MDKYKPKKKKKSNFAFYFTGKIIWVILRNPKVMILLLFTVNKCPPSL